MKKRAIIVCPGRGSYTQEDLGYLNQADHRSNSVLATIDQLRIEWGYEAVSKIDGLSKFSPATHLGGENAAALIYACSLNDFLQIDLEKFEILAVTGNSMGWYTTLALSGALSIEDGLQVINNMGQSLGLGTIGGQLIYPIYDDQWQPSPTRISHLEQTMDNTNQKSGCEVYVSIKFGNYVIVGGNDQGLRDLQKHLEPKEQKFPFKLSGHAAFHTSLLQPVASKATETFPRSMFRRPEISMVDGTGKIWSPLGTDIDDLYNYTFGKQVTELYDFSKSIEVSIKEFAPEAIILLGPGKSTGAAIGQTLINCQWQRISSKNVFQTLQDTSPILHTMGLNDQRSRVI